MSISRGLSRGLSTPLSWALGSRQFGGDRYGMWFDGVNDTVLVDGSPFNAKTTGKITGVFQTASTGVHSVCSATDAGDTASDLRINISAGKLQFAARENSGQDINVKTNATYNDGAAHTFEVKVTASGTFITMDGVLLEASELTYTDGSTSSHIWFSDVGDIDMWAIGVRQEAVPDHKFLGVVRDIKIYDEDTTTVIGHWAGHGNTNADWVDLAGSNNGTVAGSTSRAVSTDGGATWAMENASDADAAAYISLLLGDGVSVSGAQQTAINAFYVTGKAEGWYSDLKRMYLPIWAAPEPNARCLVSSTSGTFAGDMTHSSGFVTGDGSSSYFNSGATPSAMGITTGDAFILRGIHASPATALHIGCGVASISASNSLAMLNFGNTHGSAGYTYFRQSTSTAEALLTGQGAEYRGIQIGSCTATNSRFIMRRRSGGTVVGTSSVSATGAIQDLNPYFMGRKLVGYTVNSSSNGSEFAWALGTGMTQAQATDFTAALETMWETCTGLTLY